MENKLRMYILDKDGNKQYLTDEDLTTKELEINQEIIEKEDVEFPGWKKYVKGVRRAYIRGDRIYTETDESVN